jgi:hypothetical protein
MAGRAKIADARERRAPSSEGRMSRSESSAAELDHLTKGGNLELIGPSCLRTYARRSGACFAMLALILQLVASFGHVHSQDFARLGPDITGGWHKAVAAKAVASDAGKLTDDEDHCPICFSGFLLATSFVPDAGQPASFFGLGEASYSSSLVVFGLTNSDRASFRSRAPPSA